MHPNQRSTDRFADSGFPVSAHVLCLSLCLGVATGCKGHGHSHFGPIQEDEPNNAVAEAQFIGQLFVNDFVVIEGQIDDSGFDPFDGYAFWVNQPVEVEFQLTSWNGAADLDLCVFDPVIDQEVLCFESPFNPETGFFEVVADSFHPADFHLVVNSFAGASSYRLEVRTYPLPLGPVFFGSGGGESGGGIQRAEDSDVAPSDKPSKRFEAYRQRAAEMAESAESPRVQEGLFVAYDRRGRPVDARPVVATEERLLLGESLLPDTAPEVSADATRDGPADRR